MKWLQLRAELRRARKRANLGRTSDPGDGRYGLSPAMDVLMGWACNEIECQMIEEQLKKSVFHHLRYNRLLYYLSVQRHFLLGKPYFYGGLRPEAVTPMKQVARKECLRLKRPLRILEVGSFRGSSVILWFEFGHVTCIDTWPEGDWIFQRNMKLMGLQPAFDYIAYWGDSLLVLPLLIQRGYKYDLVYIDGDHTYRGCRLDLELGRKLVEAGGILCGDDLHLDGVAQAVKEVIGQVEQENYFFWTRV